MATIPFVTCDLLDDNPEKDLQVVTPSLDGKFLKVMVRVKLWWAGW